MKNFEYLWPIFKRTTDVGILYRQIRNVCKHGRGKKVYYKIRNQYNKVLNNYRYLLTVYSVVMYYFLKLYVDKVCIIKCLIKYDFFFYCSMSFFYFHSRRRCVV